MSSQPSETNSTTNSPTNTTSSAVDSPSTSTTNTSAASTGLNPVEFTKEYLGQQTLDKLKQIKKQCGFRKKTETSAEFVDAIYEWYQKNHAAKSDTSQTPKTRKPRAKKATNSAVSTVGTLTDSIRAEVAQDAAGVSSPQTATKEKKPRQSKGKKGEQPELKPITLQRKTNRVLVTLTDQEREDIRKNKEAKTKIYQFLDNIHNQLRGSSITGTKARDDIIMVIILAKLDIKMRDGLFNIFDTRTIDEGGPYNCKPFELKHIIKPLTDKMKEKQWGILELLYNSVETKLCGGTVIQPDLGMQVGMILTAHKFSSNFVKKINIFNIDNEQLLRRILQAFDVQDKFKIPTPPSELSTEPNNKPKNTKAKKRDIYSELKFDISLLTQMDAIGILYEYFNQYLGKQSKDMGQFFTERVLALMSLHLVDKEDINELGINSDSTMGDEFCGTFGLPLKTLDYFKKMFDITFKAENIYGVEYAAETFALGAANAMFSSDQYDKFKLTHGSSFNINLEPHLDVSVHNVPFGDTMRWTDIIKYAEPYAGHTDILNREITEKQNVDAVLSAQLVIYKTRKMGILIIKDGKETSSPAFEEFRRTIMNKCCVKKIMKIPGTAFTHTNTKTICIYFTKPTDGRKTGSIQFCQLNDSLDTIHEICQVPRDNLEARFCSWNPQDYLIDEHAETMKGKSKCAMVRLGDCVSMNNGKTYSSSISNSGEYPFYAATVSNPVGTHKTYDFDDNEYILFVKSGGNSKNPISKSLGIGKVYYVNGKCAANVDVVKFKLLTLNYNIKYLYYYLLNQQEYIQTLAHYTIGNGHIDMDKLKRMEIPVPSLEIQNETVAELDELGADKDALTRYHKNLDNHMKLVVKHTIKENLDNIQWRKLGDIITYKSGVKRDMSDVNKKGKFPLFSSSTTGYEMCNYSDYNEPGLIINSINATGKSRVYYSDNYAVTSNTLNVKCNDNIVNSKYIYYYLNNNINIVEAKYTGSPKAKISQSGFNEIEIPVPSLEVQQQMVARMEQIEARKQLIQAEIKTLDDMMKDTLERSYTSTARLPDFHPPTNSEIHEENPKTTELSEPVKPTQVAELVSSSSEDETESETESETDDE